eukprot:scaffold98921_cov66-Phaeocystis_antarctica.AAC.1
MLGWGAVRRAPCASKRCWQTCKRLLKRFNVSMKGVRLCPPANLESYFGDPAAWAPLPRAPAVLQQVDGHRPP